MSQVFELEKAEDFNKKIAEGITVVDFFAVWCGPCQIMKPVLHKLAAEMNEVNFMAVDVDKFSDIAAKYEVMSIPTFVIYKDGQALLAKNGAMSEADLRSWIEKNR